jgi:peptide/nickel transport system permease protein
MNRLKGTLKALTQYPSAVVGLVIIAILIGISIYAIIAIPYQEAIELWRGSEYAVYNVPRKAAPTWYNLFSAIKEPETIILDSRNEDDGVVKTFKKVSEDVTEITLLYTFDYPYQGFPQELSLFFEAKYEEKFPFADISWITPNNEEIRVGGLPIDRTLSYRISQDEKLVRRLDGLAPHIGLFADPAFEEPVALEGTYTLQIKGMAFEDDTDIDAEFVVYGQLHGIAGTDHRRRDLRVAMLWGTPIALTFGLLAAVGTTITTMTISGIGSWFGGWLDELINRITEINLILPFLPILIMVGTFYSKSLPTMLSVVILLSIFTGAIKTYRSVFLQVRTSPYIEAAQAYGASNTRIIFRYLIPRIIPMLLPGLVITIPGFVFLEAALSVLGLGDPTLPTWGKVINEARVNGALFQGEYYWMLEPSVLLMLTGLAFALLGYALDRVFNPRLRTQE